MNKFLTVLSNIFFFLTTIIIQAILFTQETQATNSIKVSDSDTSAPFVLGRIKNFFVNIDFASLAASANNFIKDYLPFLQSNIGDNLLLSFLSVFVALILLIIFIKILRVIIGFVFFIFILYLVYLFFTR